MANTTLESAVISSLLQNNSTAGNSSQGENLSLRVLTVYFFLRALCSLLAVCGNALIIISVYKFRILHQNSSYFICSLAIADLVGASTTPVLVAHQLMPDSIYYVPLCITEKVLSITSTGGGMLSICWIAIDRYIYIAHPFRYRYFVTPLVTSIIIVVTWTYVIAFTTVSFSMSTLTVGLPCKYVVFLPEAIYNYLLVPQLVGLIILSVIMHSCIAIIAHKHGRRIQALNQAYDTGEAASNRKQRKVAKMMITVVGVFLATYFPQVVMNILIRKKRTYTYLLLEKVTVVIFWCNTWINPWIYAMKSEEFKYAFKKLLGLKLDDRLAPMPPTRHPPPPPTPIRARPSRSVPLKIFQVESSKHSPASELHSKTSCSQSAPL